MIRKLIIGAVIILVVLSFYNTFMKETMTSFFGRHKGKVDFMQKGVTDYKVQNE